MNEQINRPWWESTNSSEGNTFPKSARLQQKQDHEDTGRVLLWVPWEYHLPRGNVDFQDPRLEVLIQHDVKAKELMAAVGPPHIHLQKVGHIGFWPGHRENIVLSPDPPRRPYLEPPHQWCGPEMGKEKQPRTSSSQEMPLCYSQLPGMKFGKRVEFNSGHCLLFPILSNWNTASSKSTAQQCWDLWEKRGFRVRPHTQGSSVTHEMMVLTTASFIFSQMASLFTPFWLK